MKICDSSYLIALLHPNPNPPKDRQDKPVTRFKERVSFLVEELSLTSDIIGIPTPALAETLVRSGPNRAQYMKILGDSWKFQIVPFDSRAAIETAELIAAVKNNKDKWDTWAKVKFDIQIVAIAKAEGALLIYSDDQDVENFAKRFGIRVIRICDLPLPPPKEDTPISAGPVGSQMPLALGSAAPTSRPAPPDATPDGATEPTPVSTAEDGSGTKVLLGNQLQAASAHSARVPGDDSGRAQGETARETVQEPKEENE